MTGQISILGDRGDTKIMWDSDKPEEVKEARRTFDNLRAKGYLAFKVVGKTGEKGEQITAFDAYAERLILAPSMVGG